MGSSSSRTFIGDAAATKPPVLFFRGGPGAPTLEDVKGVMEELGPLAFPERHIVLFDYRGHGLLTPTYNSHPQHGVNLRMRLPCFKGRWGLLAWLPT